MAQLIVRNLDERLVEALRRRAARNRCSAEAEHREILRQALALPRKDAATFHDYLLTMPNTGEDSDFERPRDYGRKPPRL